MPARSGVGIDPRGGNFDWQAVDDRSLTLDVISGDQADEVSAAFATERCDDCRMVPELDANRVRKWAHDRTPPDFRDEMRIEVDETPRGLTIVECRPPWSDVMGSEWTRTPIARMTYSKQAGEWTLYYADRNDRFQRYWECGPSAYVADLLAVIDADPTCIFWG